MTKKTLKAYLQDQGILAAHWPLEYFRRAKELYGEGSYIPEYVFYSTGIEIEVENIHEHPLRIKDHFLWEFKGDGSLRNGGVEGITKPLFSSKEIGVALEEFKKGFLEKWKKYDFSWRTGIHVHICPMSFEVKDMANCFLLVISLEPLLFKVFSENRKDNINCVPLTETNQNIEVIKNIIEAAEKEDVDFNWVEELVGAWPGDRKYSSVNFSRMKDIGTIEFRHLKGTDDFNLLKDWISVINLILQYAEITDYKELKKRLLQINTTSEYHIFLEDIFKNLTGKMAIPNYEKYLEEGVKKAKLFFPEKKNKVSLKVSKSGGFFSYGKKLLEKQQQRISRRFKEES